MFPSNFVEPLGVASKKEVVVDRQCVCIYDYDATDSDELNIRSGDRLTIQGEEGGWYTVVNDRNESGRVPSNYVELQ